MPVVDCPYSRILLTLINLPERLNVTLKAFFSFHTSITAEIPAGMVTSRLVSESIRYKNIIILLTQRHTTVKYRNTMKVTLNVNVLFVTLKLIHLYLYL